MTGPTSPPIPGAGAAPGKISVSPELEAAYRKTRTGVQNARASLPDETDEGIDPSTTAATSESRRKAKDELDTAEKTLTAGGKHVEEQEDNADEAEAEFGKGPDDAKLTDGKTTPSADPAASTAAPSSATPAANSGSTTPMQTPQIPQVGLPSYNPSSLPTTGSANQYDMNNAPNRDALRAEIQAALNGGGSGSGTNAQNVGYPGGSGGSVDSSQASTDYEKRILEAVDKALNNDPPIPYAWGGGHGGSPGPSQGTTDGGGYADQMGDYNKTGVDCSGFTRWMHAEASGSDSAAGTSQSQYSSGRPVTEPRVGDFAFPGDAGRPPMHVQMYIGNGKVAEAQMSGTFLKISDVKPGTEYRRFGPDD